MKKCWKPLLYGLEGVKTPKSQHKFYHAVFVFGFETGIHRAKVGLKLLGSEDPLPSGQARSPHPVHSTLLPRSHRTTDVRSWQDAERS